MIAADARLPAAMVAEMIDHAERAAPREACGLVAYTGAGRPARLYPLTNVASDPAAFCIDPGEHYRTILHAETSGWRIGAVYHSHPYGPARPSRTDLAAEIDPDWISFILGRSMRGWRIRPFAMIRGVSIRLG